MRLTCLDAEIAPIDIIAQEEITSFAGIAANFEQFHEIKVLAMYVSTHSYRSIHL